MKKLITHLVLVALFAFSGCKNSEAERSAYMQQLRSAKNDIEMNASAIEQILVGTVNTWGQAIETGMSGSQLSNYISGLDYKTYLRTDPKDFHKILSSIGRPPQGCESAHAKFAELYSILNSMAGMLEPSGSYYSYKQKVVSLRDDFKSKSSEFDALAR